MLGLVFAFVTASLLLLLVITLIGRQWTMLQLAWSILLGVPIFCGTLMWLKAGPQHNSERRIVLNAD